MGGPIKVNYNVIELPCISCLYGTSFWEEDCASLHSVIGANHTCLDSQEMVLTLDPGVVSFLEATVSWERPGSEKLSSALSF